MAISGMFKGHTVTELERMILWELGQVASTTISYSRFPKWLIRLKLTERQIKFAKLSECLRRYALVSLVDGYRTYPLPRNCMDNGVLSVRYYEESDRYDDLELKDEAWLDEKYEGWKVAAEGIPEYAFRPQSFGNVQTIGLYPTPATSGTAYSAGTMGTGIYYGATLPQAAHNITGVTTALGSGTTLTATGTNFTTLGIVAGQYALNRTDGSYARVVTLADGTLTTAALAGGSDNTWQSGDTWEILCGEYMVEISQAYGERYLFGYKEGALETITIPDETLVLTYLPYPLPFTYDATAADASQTNDSQYSELPREHHIALAYGVIADLLGSFHEASREFQRAGFYEEKFNFHVLQARGDGNTRPFAEKEVKMYPGRRR